MIGFKYSSIGKKKTSVARVYLKKDKRGKILVNNIPYYKYFNDKKNINIYKWKKYIAINFNIIAFVKGGGKNSQLKAIEFGINKSILEFNPKLIKIFKKKKLLKDLRKVERKKIGFVKSRKKKQFSKR
ncbi:30S ribosomal protein S9 [Candidatus Vidania fulgoroideorum]